MKSSQVHDSSTAVLLVPNNREAILIFKTTCYEQTILRQTMQGPSCQPYPIHHSTISTVRPLSPLPTPQLSQLPALTSLVPLYSPSSLLLRQRPPKGMRLSIPNHVSPILNLRNSTYYSQHPLIQTNHTLLTKQQKEILQRLGQPKTLLGIILLRQCLGHIIDR